MAFDYVVGFLVASTGDVLLLPVIWCVFRAFKPDSRRGRDFYFRLISLWLYLSFYIWLIFLLICEVVQCHHAGIRYVAIFMLGMSYVVVLIESGCSRELAYLQNISKDEAAWQYIETQQLLVPKIYMTVECWHNQWNTETTRFTYREKVVTFEETEEFVYDTWVDVSQRDPLAGFKGPLARVVIVDPGILFGDQQTFDEYRRLAAAMAERNRYRDASIDFSLSVEYPGMEESFLGYLDLRVKPSWVRPLYFWIASFLQMAWPYRWLFRTQMKEIDYTVKKKIYKNVATPPNDERPLDATITDMVVVSAAWILDSMGHPPIPQSRTSHPFLAPYLAPLNPIRIGASNPANLTGMQFAAFPASYGPTLVNVTGPAGLNHPGLSQLVDRPPSYEEVLATDVGSPNR